MSEVCAEDETLLTAEEVAPILRVTKKWIYRAVRRDEIPHVKLGRFVRFRRADIDEWIRQGGTRESG